MEKITEKINKKFDEIDAEIKSIQSLLSKKGYAMMGEAIDRLTRAGAPEAMAEADEAQIIPGVEIWETKPEDAIAYLRKTSSCGETTELDYKVTAKDMWGHVMTLAELKARGAFPFGDEWVYSHKIENEIKRRKSNLRDELRWMVKKLTEKAKDDREQWLLFAKYNSIIMLNSAKCSTPFRLDFSEYLSAAKKERLEKVKEFARRKSRERGYLEIVIAIDDAFSDFHDFFEFETGEDCSTEIMWYDAINAETVSIAATLSLMNTELLTPEQACKDEREYEEELCRCNDDYNDDELDDFSEDTTEEYWGDFVN